MPELEKVYAPAGVERKWSAFWRDFKIFHTTANSAVDQPFVIVIPPPNVTGALHIGHALNNTIQDVLVRFYRLMGRPVCWVPGTDHGGIATNSVMEKQLRAEGTSRQQLGRDKFLKRTKEWTVSCKSTILGQLERLGCALDWEREAFTMDDARSKAVYAAFEQLWKRGLIKRGERMVNWCVRCGTALSDIEVEYEDRKGKLWHMKYPSADGGEGLVVATTRPETMLGDTGVAVNPRDPRYASLIGKQLKLPLMDRPIPVVADDSVDFAFGTGAVKVTPAHDPNDFEVAQRHKLASIKVIGPDGKMTAAAGAYAGLSREAARDKILKDLGDAVVKIDEHPHSVGVCYRCGQIIEPLLSWQWFVKMTPMATRAIETLEFKHMELHPPSWMKPYEAWLENIKDWPISRQIWWGHRIPVWYCLNCNRHLAAAAPRTDGTDWSIHQIASVEGVVGDKRPQKCERCGSGDFVQDPDVLDTWFSSSLWPFAVFGWPEQTPELKAFYPTSVLVTGYEILYLWVARMQMMGLEFLRECPFHDVIIHGIVRDKTGKKMSKSLGNVIDPLVMMEKYGTDAFRFSLMLQAHPGRDIPFSEESIVGSRNFANKLWNSTRFVLMNLPKEPPAGGYSLSGLALEELDLASRWILAEYQMAIFEVNERLKKFEVAAAADVVYGFLWDKFCDWYVELSKLRLTGPDGEAKEATRAILVNVLSGTLKMLHPFMPFITEELHEALRSYTGELAPSIAVSSPPALDIRWKDDSFLKQMSSLMEMISAVRTLRSELNVPPGMKISVSYETSDSLAAKLVDRNAEYLLHLARVGKLEPAGKQRPPQSATTVAASVAFHVPLAGVIDVEQERKRLTKTVSELSLEVFELDQRLSNSDFLLRAPREKVEEIRSRRQETAAKQTRLQETLKSLA